MTCRDSSLGNPFSPICTSYNCRKASASSHDFLSTFGPDFTFAYGSNLFPLKDRFKVLDCHFDALPCVSGDSPHRCCDLLGSLNPAANAMLTLYISFWKMSLRSLNTCLSRCHWHHSLHHLWLMYTVHFLTLKKKGHYYQKAQRNLIPPLNYRGSFKKIRYIKNHLY